MKQEESAKPPKYKKQEKRASGGSLASKRVLSLEFYSSHLDHLRPIILFNSTQYSEAARMRGLTYIDESELYCSE